MTAPPGMATDTVFPTTTVSSSHLTCFSRAASANSKANALARFAVRLTSRTIALHRPRAGVSLGHYRMCDTEVEEPRCAKQSRERKRAVAGVAHRPNAPLRSRLRLEYSLR